MEIYARQGDLVIDKLSAPITGELAPARDTVFAGDSSGHPHRLTGAHLIRRETRDGAPVFLVRVEEKRSISHGKPDGHRNVTLVPGDYEIRPLRERGGVGDRPVQD